MHMLISKECCGRLGKDRLKTVRSLKLEVSDPEGLRLLLGLKTAGKGAVTASDRASDRRIVAYPTPCGLYLRFLVISSILFK